MTWSECIPNGTHLQTCFKSNRLKKQGLNEHPNRILYQWKWKSSPVFVGNLLGRRRHLESSKVAKQQTMPPTPQETNLNLLRHLEENPNITQRELAKELGLE